MPAISQFTLWTSFLVFLFAMLSLDLFIFRRKPRVITLRESLFWTGLWMSLAFGFAVLLLFLPGMGGRRAKEFLTGYILEQALSVDNLFVFMLIFGEFAVPAAYQHRVLFWGIIGAILLRGLFIIAGTALIERFEWVLYIFGLFLVVSGFRLLIQSKAEHEHYEENRLIRWLRRWVPVTSGYRKEAFFVRENGRLMATPLFIVLVAIEFSDLVFAIDSIPTVFGVTTHPFIVFTSNMFAILGLRSIYAVLEHLLPLFRFLGHAVAIVLIFIGVKILLRHEWLGAIHISEGLSLAIVATLLLGSIVLSKWIPEPSKQSTFHSTKDEKHNRGIAPKSIE
ncbi:MAG: TerC family protein [Sandaracinaceae bacterium]|nr:TerC family protein [Sandaracinaceae bacterium]